MCGCMCTFAAADFKLHILIISYSRMRELHKTEHTVVLMSQFATY